MEETGVPGVNYQPAQVTDKLDHIMLYRVHQNWQLTEKRQNKKKFNQYKPHTTHNKTMGRINHRQNGDDHVYK